MAPLDGKLKSIAIQAKVDHCISHVRLEEFAELIIKECAKIAYLYTSDPENYKYYDDVGWDCLPSDVEDEIKLFFGVKR